MAIVHAVRQDLRFARRSLTQNPLFTLVALTSLGLGIGANAAIFSLLDQALLRVLPVRHPEELVLLQASGPRRGSVNTSYDDTYTFSYPMYRDFRDGAAVFSDVLARYPSSFGVGWGGATERVTGDIVSGNYFEMLGVRSVVGRTFTQDDDRIPGAQPVMVLSYAYWKSRFGGDPGVLHQNLVVNGRPVTVIGVAEPGFHGVGVGERPSIFVPMMMREALFPEAEHPDGGDLTNRRAMWLNIFARLKTGVSRKQAEAAMNTFWRPILESEVKLLGNASPSLRARFLNRHLTMLAGAKGISGAPQGFGAAMIVLMMMVGLLLLIACANVANLLLARSTARQKEFGIRLALGAGRLQIARQLLTESLLLAFAGGLLGLVVASWTGAGLLGFLPSDVAVSGLTSHLDTRVFAFTFGLTVVTGVLFGIAPAFQSARRDVSDILKGQASAVIGGGHVRFRKALVMSQVALSLVLLAGAGLFARSLFNVKRIDPGFHTDHLISFAVQPKLNGYSDARTLALCERLYDELAAVPGVRAVSVSEITLLSGDNIMSTMEITGYHPKEGESMSIDENYVGPGYFAALGMPLLAGRDFRRQDGPAAPRVAIINQTMAQAFFGKDSPLGRKLRFARDSKDQAGIEIVGVVKDGKHADLREKAQRFAYFPYSQYPLNERITFYVRTAQEPASVMGMLRQAVHRVDSNIPVFNLKGMDRQIAESIFMDRLVAALSAAFGGLATLLAGVGLYGVIAYMVMRRTREIGIRMALGAGRGQVLGMVMREVALLAGSGIGIALLISLALGRWISSQLFGVSGRDPLVLFGATACLGLVALVAGYLPALRATRVDPLAALRQD